MKKATHQRSQRVVAEAGGFGDCDINANLT
jgi:hypothetical protein